jgi:hypothetical protein
MMETIGPMNRHTPYYNLPSGGVVTTTSAVIIGSDELGGM